jgi:hypothetical protein
MDLAQSASQTATGIIAKAHQTLSPPIWDYITGAVSAAA